MFCKNERFMLLKFFMAGVEVYRLLKLPVQSLSGKRAFLRHFMAATRSVFSTSDIELVSCKMRLL